MFKKIFSFLMIMIVLFQFQNVNAKNVTDKKVAAQKKSTAQKKSVWQPEIRIGILRGVTQANFQVSAPCVMIDSKTQKVIQKIDAEKNFAVDFVALKNDSVEIRGEKIQLKDLQIKINGKEYFGGARINKVGGTLTVINLAPVEEYLRGVVPEEMPPTFNPEALKSQSVAARSFTLKNRKRHEAEGFDLCTTTHCQVYEGTNNSAAAKKAVAETRGEVLFFGGKIADTNFHTDSGGMTENVSDVWGSHVPYLQAVQEVETQTQPWTVKVSKKDFDERMGSSFGNLKSISLSNLVIGKSANDRTQSGRVKFALIAGTNKNIKLTGAELRSKFSLPSTLFNMKFENGEIIFEGFGRGHGVGMSQYGAESYAQKGWTYDKILLHYYRGTELKKLY